MLDSYRDLIDELLGMPTTLRRLLADRPGDPPPAALGLIHELRDRDRVVLGRLQTMLHEPNAHLRPLGPPTAGAGAESPEATLEAFDAARGDLVSLLMNLTLKDWARTATHDVEGEVTVADEVERHVEFDEAHVARIREALGG